MVIVNQAANYLTVGIVNAFAVKFEHVSLITGSVHVQGETLNERVSIHYINKWKEENDSVKIWIYFKALIRVWFLLLFKYRRYEVFFISVPPMAYLLNIFLPNRCSMLIWDVYPDALKILGMKETHPFYRLWAFMNKKSFVKAYRLFTIGDRMADLLEKYISRNKIIVQPIWSVFQENRKITKNNNPFIRQHKLQDKFIVQYSGNIGLTHKVEVVVELAERMKEHTNILFMIIGRGPRKKILQETVERKKLDNCIFLPFQSDDMFPYSLSAANLGVVVLDELTSKGSVPSKSYNLMSLGIPSLYIAAEDSELKSYADEFGHAVCYSENQLGEAVKFILELSTSPKKYKVYSENALKASVNFKRDNADKIVEYYLNQK
jgi:hypothetical protein